ncbi:MAG TPA: 3-oxoacyl-ACP synthase [Bacteroidales bacterium]|nr:3-oxoacyl-ACP synthase [Bacteroidales bacterium]
MAVYINGIGAISPQETKNSNSFLENILEYSDAYLPISEPNYKDYIDPKDLRRMSKIIRNGIIAARISLDDSGLKMPEAIITGTGLGCAIDTEKFLISIAENKETLLTPTNFIQSTHNTIGGSIAIGLGCHEYNMTYVHRGFSFETALHDAMMMLEADEIQNALVGGFDEMTDNHIILLKSSGDYQKNGFSNLQLKHASYSGTIAGQGASFFVLEKEKKSTSYAQLLDMKMLYKPKSKLQIEEAILTFLSKNNLNAEDIDLLLMGYNGINAETRLYDAIAHKLFSDKPIAWFKHLCGEYYTAAAFGTWVAAQILQKQQLPESILYKGKNLKNINTILLYNQFQQEEHSLILFSKC